MAHKTFISYKWSEAQQLRDDIIDALGEDASYYKGETSDSPDLTDTTYTVNHKYLRIFDRRSRRPVYTFVVFVLLRQISGSCPDHGSRSSIKR